MQFPDRRSLRIAWRSDGGRPSRGRPAGPPQLRSYGTKEFEVRDRGGYVICFGQGIKEPAA